MDTTNWLRQTDRPLFEDLLWSRPEQKSKAGSLMIIGGHKHDVFAPLKAFEISENTGIGKATVVTSEKAPPAITGAPQVVTVPANPSGSISISAYDAMLAMASDSDAMLWPGSLGRDSETVQLLEKLLMQTRIPTVLSGDALDSSIRLKSTLEQSNTLLVITMAQLRNLQTTLHGTKPISLNMQLTTLIELLSKMTKEHAFSVITLYEDQLIASVNGQVSTTKLNHSDNKEEMRWRVAVASLSAVLWAQFKEKPFEALTSAVWLFKEDFT